MAAERNPTGIPDENRITIRIWIGNDIEGLMGSGKSKISEFASSNKISGGKLGRGKKQSESSKKSVSRTHISIQTYGENIAYISICPRKEKTYQRDPRGGTQRIRYGESLETDQKDLKIYDYTEDSFHTIEITAENVSGLKDRFEEIKAQLRNYRSLKQEYSDPLMLVMELLRVAGIQELQANNEERGAELEIVLAAQLEEICNQNLFKLLENLPWIGSPLKCFSLVKMGIELNLLSEVGKVQDFFERNSMSVRDFVAILETISHDQQQAREQLDIDDVDAGGQALVESQSLQFLGAATVQASDIRDGVTQEPQSPKNS